MSSKNNFFETKKESSGIFNVKSSIESERNHLISRVTEINQEKGKEVIEEAPEFSEGDKKTESEIHFVTSKFKAHERSKRRNPSESSLASNTFLLKIKDKKSEKETSCIESEKPKEMTSNFISKGSNLFILDTLTSNFKLTRSKREDEKENEINHSESKREDDNLTEECECNSNSDDKSHENSESYSGSNTHSEYSEEARDQVEDLEKVKHENAKKLWGKAKNIIKGITSFQKMRKNLQLYGTSDEEFDEKNPEKYLNKLKRIQTSHDIKENEANNGKNKHCCHFSVPVLDPDGKIMNIWNMIIFILMIYTAIIMPYRVAFINVDSETWQQIENAVDLIFFVDVLVTLNVSYYDNDNTLVTSRKKIFLTYLKSWLIVDLVASFPQNLIFNSQQTSSIANKTDILRLARLTRLYRLVRIIRFLKIAKFFKKVAFIQKIQDFFSINYGISRLISFLFTTLIISHLVGCLWYILPLLYDEQINWVVQTNLQNQDSFRLYLFSLYWSFATIFTVGFGDIHAYNTIEYVISIFWMLFGVGFYSFTIGTLSSVLVNMDTRENILKSKLAILNEFSKETMLSSTLKERVKKILVYNSQKNVFSWMDKQEIFNELPANLKFEIAKSMRCGFLKDILFFASKDDAFIAMIVPFLLPLNFQEKEPIYKKLDHPNAIYFLNTGRIHFVNDDNIPFRTMVKGSYFGEIDIILKQKRSHTVISGENCDTLTLSRQIYENIIIKEYPEIHEEIKYIAELRLRKNAEAEKELNERLNIAPKTKHDSFEIDTQKSKSNLENNSNNKLSRNKSKKDTTKLTTSNTHRVHKAKHSENKVNNVNNINIYSTTYNTKIINNLNVANDRWKHNTSNHETSNILINEKNELENKHLSVNQKTNSPKSHSQLSKTSDNPSDYFSGSEQEKIENKIKVNQIIAHNAVNEEGSLMGEKKKESLKEIKEELAKYTNQQQDMMQNINFLLNKLK